MITELRVSGLRIVLEKTPLVEVRNRFGGTIGYKGDAGDFLSWLCLHGTDLRGKWVLWLTSDEIDGGSVGGFRLQRVEHAAEFDKRCQMLPEKQGGVELPIALQLGIEEAKVVSILGEPTRRSSQTFLYLHEHEEMIHNQPYWAANSVAVLLRGGIAWAIEVRKSTTS
jgi:hypothetical protein